MIDTKALREKVLDLAIRGKLVPQDPNDEPATVLLERIREQKKQMVKEGKLKAKDIKNDTIIFKGDDNLHYEQFADGTVKCIEDEIPFQLPKGWAWSRLETITSVITDYVANGSFASLKENVKTYKEKNYALFVRTVDFANNFQKDLSYIDKESYDFLEKSKLFGGELMLSNIGASIGKVFKVPYFDIPMSLAPNSIILRFFDDITSDYFEFVFKSFVGQNYLQYLSGGAAMPKFNKTDLRAMIVPLAPLNEQNRMVISTKNCFSIVDEIETSQTGLSNIISVVKSKILDLAIRGQLVPQDPNDEPASVLLERIRAEKEELIKAGKIKRDKKESVIFKGDDNSYYEKVGNEVTCIDGEVLFEIPQGWCYTRLSSISEIIMGSSPNGTSINRNGNGMEFHQGKICFTDKIIGHSISFTDKSVKLAKENSLLLCVRAPVGEVNITDRCVCIGRGLAAISPLSKMQTEFLFYWLQSFKKVLLQKATGSTFVAITADTVKNICIPLPPLEEQNRICKAIDKIFVVLDIIEQSLN